MAGDKPDLMLKRNVWILNRAHSNDVCWYWLDKREKKSPSTFSKSTLKV